ncbi:MAG: hypothetical protein SFV15_11980 [Polyangiaceae bacterium]|nr:hypothetical protein [Polyangiaceae bacterium]
MEDAKDEAEAHLSGWRIAHLDLAPKIAPTTRLAFGRGWLAQVTQQRLAVVETKTFRTIVEVPVNGHAQVVTVFDGGFLAVDDRQLLRLLPREAKFRTYARPTFFAGSQLIPNPRDYETFYVFHHPTPTIYSYALDDRDALKLVDAGLATTTRYATLPISQTLALDGTARTPAVGSTPVERARAFALLRDGSFAVAFNEQVIVTTVSGWSHAFSLKSSEFGIQRMIPGASLQQAWVITGDGALKLLQFAGTRAKVVASVPGHASVIDLGVAGKLLLSLELAPPGTGVRHFRVVARGFTGEEQFSVEVGALSNARGVDWAKQALADKNFAVSPYEPIFGLSGDASLRVFSSRTGALVFDSTSISH